ncbi:4Fe-4S binding protein [Trichlorobacter lovleyi]|uniref:4Fe-4S binding protein n=1 Tax=Trichlorobacter lovleyi TaxID=313985 RepID=UPI0023F01388|nr:4Fe-4S binding protein [Trichlorobacter lovleyi]
MNMLSPRNITRIRLAVQWLFLLWIAGIGIRFGLFVAAVEQGNPQPFFSRPAGVEGFLPIGALTSLKHWIVSGEIHPVHPAALVIFLAILLMSLLAKKSFCSWICPVGTLSEALYKLGARLLGRNFKVWRPLDLLLQGIKYLLLFFFIKIILLDMPAFAVAAFLDTPYWAVSDAKMLRFFTQISATTVTVLTVLTLLSLIYRNVWCRYLCPYGALLGILSLLSPFKIRRNPQNCTDCRQCSQACPAGIAVHAKTTVVSPECTGCLTCVATCPHQEVLAMQPSFWKQSLPVWVFPTVVLGLFMGSIGFGMVSGHWQTVLTVDDYRQLLPMLPYLSH